MREGGKDIWTSLAYKIALSLDQAYIPAVDFILVYVNYTYFLMREYQLKKFSIAILL